MTPVDTDQVGSSASSRMYWLYQFAGWGLYTLYVLTFTVMNVGFDVKAIASVVGFLSVACPLVTHGLRLWMRRRGWMRLSVPRLLPRLAGIVLALAVLLTGLTFFVNLAVLHTGRWQDWWPGAAIGMSIGYTMAFSGWLGIYFSVLARRRRRALEIKALQLEVVAHDARLSALESQLNPHFLFNCLNSVRALVVEDPDRAQAMITRLAELLRYSLRSDGQDTVTLEEELQAVHDYLTLERVRFEERLATDVTVEPRAAGAHVPRMSILTLVENAVKHGIGHLAEGGVVRIAARFVADRLQIDVSNSGSLSAEAQGAGLGLRNARERLRLLYGDAASLTLTAPDRRSVVATISLPVSGTRPAAGGEATA